MIDDLKSSGDANEPPKTEPTEPATPTTPLKQLPAKGQRRFHIWPRRWSTKKKRIFTGLSVVLILAIFGGGYYWYQNSQQKLQPNNSVGTPKAPPKPTTEASRLTGIQISLELNKRAVTGVMIENSPEARPQSGLQDAGVVYEAIAECGITRFLA